MSRRAHRCVTLDSGFGIIAVKQQSTPLGQQSAWRLTWLAAVGGGSISFGGGGESPARVR
eukprot:scaffold48263_cov33-Cyclotella_meneghiniana.AAC.2